MSNQLYTVTVTDLATYRLTVAADCAAEAVNVGKHVICEEMTRGTSGVTIVSRELEGAADMDPAATGEAQQYEVEATYSIDFGVKLPATTREDAVRYARWLQETHYGPFEFELGEHRTTGWCAREVQP